MRNIAVSGMCGCMTRARTTLKVPERRDQPDERCRDPSSRRVRPRRTGPLMAYAEQISSAAVKPIARRYRGNEERFEIVAVETRRQGEDDSGGTRRRSWSQIWERTQWIGRGAGVWFAKKAGAMSAAKIAAGM